MTAVPPTPPTPQGFPQAGASPSPAAPKATATFAIVALVVGVIGICVPGMGVVAVLFGIVALVQISRDPGRLTGKPLAVTGSVLGAIGLIVSMLIVYGMLHALSQARSSAQNAIEMSNMRQIFIAYEAYASDYGNYQTPYHPALVVDQFVPVDVFASPLNGGGTAPLATPVPPPGDAPFRYGDLFFTYPITITEDEKAFYYDSIVIFGLPHAETDYRRNVLLGSGDVVAASPDEFEAMIKKENAARAKAGIGPQIDLDALPGALPPGP